MHHLQLETELKSDSIVTANMEQPEKTIFRNIEIDTTKLFGTWIQDSNAPFADFHINRESFSIVDFEGKGNNPYILEKSEIIVFYKSSIHKGTITSTKNDTLKIKWLGNKKETEYVIFKN